MTPRSPVSAARMLTVLAYFRRQDGPTRVSEAARALEITEKQLRDTLTQLWTCGLPGYGPGDLIDLAFWSEPAEVPGPGSGSGDDGAGTGSGGSDSFDDDADLARADYVEVIEFAGITRPLRLTFEEAITLKTALAALAGRDEVVDPEGLEEALQMLSAVAPADVPLDAMATGSGPSSSGGVSGGGTATELRAALRQGHAVRFLYYSAGSDSTRLRVVDGGHLHVEPEHSYLRGVDRESGDWRTFRTDRIAEVEDFGPAREVGPEPEVGEDEKPMRTIRAEIPAASAWFTGTFPFREIDWRADGSAEVTIDYYKESWLRRFLLGNAAHLRPLDEGALRGVADEAESALAHYSKRS